MGREREAELPFPIVPRGLLTFASQWNLDKRSSRCEVLAVTNDILRPSNSIIFDITNPLQNEQILEHREERRVKFPQV